MYAAMIATNSCSIPRIRTPCSRSSAKRSTPRPAGRLEQAAPESKTLLDLAFAQGESAGSQTAQLMKLLDQYGAAALRRAIAEALQRNTPRASSVAFLLRRQPRSTLLAVDLSRHPQAQSLDVRPHDLETYDELARTQNNTMTTIASNSLSSQLQQIGLCALPAQLDDFIARATKSRWSTHQILEQLVKAEATERSRRSLERRLRISGIKSFKPMADFDWSWPTKIEREVIERALTLDFMGSALNLILVGRNGLGKTMIAQNICHAAVLAGHSVLFRSAAALLEELHRQTPEGRRRKLRAYANVGLLVHR